MVKISFKIDWRHFCTNWNTLNKDYKSRADRIRFLLRTKLFFHGTTFDGTKQGFHANIRISNRTVYEIYVRMNLGRKSISTTYTESVPFTADVSVTWPITVQYRLANGAIIQKMWRYHLREQYQSAPADRRLVTKLLIISTRPYH
jgi:hypothetical protein